MGRFSGTILSGKGRGQRENERIAAVNNDRPIKGSLESSQDLEALAMSTRPGVAGDGHHIHIPGLAIKHLNTLEEFELGVFLLCRHARLAIRAAIIILHRLVSMFNHSHFPPQWDWPPPPYDISRVL